MMLGSTGDSTLGLIFISILTYSRKRDICTLLLHSGHLLQQYEKQYALMRVCRDQKVSLMWLINKSLECKSFSSRKHIRYGEMHLSQEDIELIPSARHNKYCMCKYFYMLQPV